MQVIDQSWSLEHPRHRVQEAFTEMVALIERAGRTCYKSEDKMTDSSGPEFVRRVIDSGHESVIEHANISVRIITDRGVSHEWVRHRIGSYSQESTRYANYSKDKFGSEITVIRPVWYPRVLIDGLGGLDTPVENMEALLRSSPPIEREVIARASLWKALCSRAEDAYLTMIKAGASPQEARSVLPNSLKTELVATHNIREWRHIFNLRCQKAAHPQIRELCLDMLDWFSSNIPVLFDDLRGKYLKECSCGPNEACSRCADKE